MNLKGEDVTAHDTCGQSFRGKGRTDEADAQAEKVRVYIGWSMKIFPRTD